MYAAGVNNHVLEKWLGNPTVDGKGVFDHMYGLDGEQCAKKAAALAGKIASKQTCVLSHNLLSNIPIRSTQASFDRSLES